MDNSPKETNNLSKWLIPLNICMGIAVLGLCGYIAHSKGYLDSLININTKTDKTVVEEKKETEKEQKKEEDDDEYTTYNGTKISVKLPKGWEIKEYFDGDGGAASSVPLKGFTAMKLFKDNKEILSFRALYGIGFNGCPKLAHFPDSNPTYENEKKEMSKDIEPTVLTNYSASEYMEFNLLGKRMRLTKDNKIVHDTISGEVHFEPQCEEAFIPLQGLNYKAQDDNYEYEVFEYSFKTTLSDTERTELVSVLGSITKK